METATQTVGPPTPASPAWVASEEGGDQCVVLRDVGWKGYRTLLRVRGQRPRPRMIYLDGSVYLATTSYLHRPRDIP